MGASMDGSYASDGDGHPDINLSSHTTGDPFGTAPKAIVSVGHTWLIVVVALALLWLLGAGVFKGIRM